MNAISQQRTEGKISTGRTKQKIIQGRQNFMKNLRQKTKK
jgi:hypothetical protein